MARSPLVLALAACLLAAGCLGATAPPSADADEGADAGDPPTQADAATQEWEDRVHTWQGSISAAGVCRDADPTANVGSFSPPQTFRVPPNATTLVLELTWGPAPLDLCLTLSDPDGGYHVLHRDAGDLIGTSLRAEIPEPAIGPWDAMVILHGAGHATYDAKATITQ